MKNLTPNYYLPQWIEPSAQRLTCDVCIYGGTAAGVIAAVTATRRGLSALIVNPSGHLGGMTTGGLGLTDFGQKHVIGGASRQFYRDLGKFYGKPAGEEEWLFEPRAARTVIDGYVKNAGITVLSRHFLDGVESEGGAIRRIRLLGGKTVEAGVFIDATYEGDLLAKAGVTYTIGREPNRRYGETINGVQVHAKHQFSHSVDPYVVPRDPSSGTLPGIDEQDAATDGSGDHRLQAYNFRICMTDDPALKVPWEKPEGYVERDFELARRWYSGEKDTYNETVRADGAVPQKFDVLTARTAAGFVKTDTNNHGPVSSDFIGANYLWPEASYAARERMFQEHVTYQKGLYWTLANDPRIPARYREAFGRFGLARDEFTDTNHWPHQLYVREARRMISDYVLTEHDALHRKKCEDPVAMGSYALDSHNCSRFVRNGRVLNEGDVQLPPAGPYGISYRSIVPVKGECTNLIVPVCLSSSHIAYGTVRMEPVFMVMAESAGLAASIAIRKGVSVQDVPYSELRRELDAAGQVLETK
jgi:hypothetical protein